MKFLLNLRGCGQEFCRRDGFSFIELLIAVTLLSVLIMSALPLLGHGGRNLAYAKDGYTAHLAAQSIKLAVRDTLISSGCEDEAMLLAAEYAARLGIESYTVWVISAGSPAMTFGSPDAPPSNAVLTGLYRLSFSEDTIAVVVAVWNEHGFIAGRAIGVAIIVPPNTEGILNS
ncbi:MAG: prepilin-type N-terminal cleavage/methylation domain-containing protein [Defluviitaleaceae bacterium]|nr:prepilin-type N-terminal cleavage/methylation domain-containing protein [Defluviitaleaceae bacterium]